MGLTEKQLLNFKKYFDELYGKGLAIANWHLNGHLESFDNFYESAIESMDDNYSPVTWQEAIEAWANGKTIRCIKENGCELTFKGHQEFLRDEVDALDRNQITHGTWYIEN